MMSGWAMRMSVVWMGLGLGMILFGKSAQAHILSAVDGNSRIDVNAHSQSGLFTWRVDGTDHMFQEWWWGRGEDVEPEESLDELTLLEHTLLTPYQISLRYDEPDEATVEVLYSLFGGAPGSGSSTIGELVRVTNTSNEPFDLRLFEYTDLDLNGTFGGDRAEFVAPDMLVQTEGVTRATVTSLSPVPNRWEIGPYPSILTKLNDGLPTTLANATSPLGPGDMTHAFQYNFDDLQPGSFVEIRKLKQLSVIPEPSSLLLFGLGTVGLIRRRKARKT